MKKIIIFICLFRIAHPCGIDIVALLLRQIGITKVDNLKKFERTQCSNQDDNKDKNVSSDPDQLHELEVLIQQRITEIVADYCSGKNNMTSENVWDRVTQLYNIHASSFSEEKRAQIFSMLKVEKQIREQKARRN